MTGRTKKIIIISSIAGLIAIASTVFAIGKKNSIKRKTAAGNTDIKALTVTEADVIFPLKKGSGYDNKAESMSVILVQRYLNAKIAADSFIGYSLLIEDGKFGLNTENALRRIAGVTVVSHSLYRTIKAELSVLTNSSLYPKASILDY